MDHARTILRQRLRRRFRVRRHIRGTAERPRLTVFRTHKHIYAQVIDDAQGRTVASASTLQGHEGATSNVDAASAVGKRIAEAAKAAGATQVVFDRGGFLFQGRVKALADAAREGGLEF